MKKLFNLSFFYLILGIAIGISFREFNMIYSFTGTTELSGTHTHALVLGFMFFLIVLILEKLFTLSNIKSFNVWIIVYNIGLLSLLSTLVVRGVLQVLNKDFAGLPHIAGTSHAILGISLVWFMIILKKSIFIKK